MAVPRESSVILCSLSSSVGDGVRNGWNQCLDELSYLLLQPMSGKPLG